MVIRKCVNFTTKSRFIGIFCHERSHRFINLDFYPLSKACSDQNDWPELKDERKNESMKIRAKLSTSRINNFQVFCITKYRINTVIFSCSSGALSKCAFSAARKMFLQTAEYWSLFRFLSKWPPNWRLATISSIFVSGVSARCSACRINHFGGQVWWLSSAKKVNRQSCHFSKNVFRKIITCF